MSGQSHGPGFLRFGPDEMGWLPALKEIYRHESKVLSGPGASRNDIENLLWSLDDVFEGRKPSVDERKRYSDLVDWMVKRRLAMRVQAPGSRARYATRVGETVRLLGRTHEYWHAGRPAIEAVRWLVEDKRVPLRSIPEPIFEQRLLAKIDEGVRPDWRKQVAGAAKQAMAGVSSVLAGGQTGGSRSVGFSEFQLDAATKMILSEFGTGEERPAQVITAGVGSGKTYAFVIPTLVSALASLRRGDDRERRTTILVYPRKALAYDQYHGLLAVKSNLGATALKIHFDHNSEYKRLGFASVARGVDAVYGGREPAPHIIITTLETLKRRLFNPAFMSTVPRTLRRVVVDEIHLVEGLGGAHAVRILDRLRAACKTSRPRDDLLWTAASATIAQPHVHAATVFGLRQSDVAVVEPGEDEMEAVGLVHHVFLRPTGEISTLGTLVNATSVLIHNRRGQLSDRNERKVEANPKTIAFADNLDMLGRWNSDLKENERTEEVGERRHAKTDDLEGWKPRQREVPYAARFSRPLQARIDAGLPEAAPGLHQVLQEHRGEKLCERCQNGELVDLGQKSQEELKRLSELVYRRPLKDDDKIEVFRIVSPEVFERGEQQVGTLNLCPYLRAGACFWFADEACRPLPIPYTDPVQYEFAEVARSKVHSSKTTSDDELGGELEDIVFKAPVSEVYDTGERDKEIAVDTVMASPSLEVGVDLSNLTESIMFHAIRNVASYRQKAGRIGRERGSDSVNVSLMANRPIDLHYYRQPRKLVSLAQLDPIPLKANNLSVLKNALYTATWDWLALKSSIPEFVTAAKTSDGKWEFTARLSASLQDLRSRRAEVAQHLSIVSRNLLPPDSPEVEESIGQVERELGFLLQDISGEFAHAERVSDMVPSLFAGARVSPMGGASKLLDRINIQAEYYKALRPGVTPVQLGLVKEFGQLDMMIECGWSLGVLSEALEGLERARSGPGSEALEELAEPLRKIKSALEAWGKNPLPLYFHRQLDRLFGSTGRAWEVHYLSYLIEDLDVFRLLKEEKEYVRMKDLYSNPYEDQVDIEGAVRDRVRLSEALFSLIPGTWTFRFGRSAKTKSGDLIGRNGVLSARYSELTKVGSFEAIRTEVPGPPRLGHGFDVFRPTRLTLFTQRESDSRLPSKYLRFDPESGLVIDGDEGHGGREREEGGRYPPVKIPKSYLNRWVHVEGGKGIPIRVMEQERIAERLVIVGERDQVSAKGQAAQEAIEHPLAKSLLSGVFFHNKLEIIEYVYSVSRTYTNKQMSGVELVFEGPTGRPMAFGSKMETEGISIGLKPSTVTKVRNRVVEGMRKGDPIWAPSALKAFGSYLALCGLEEDSRASPFLTRDLLSIVAILTGKKRSPWSTAALQDSLKELASDPELLRRTAVEYYSKSLKDEATDEESIGEPDRWSELANKRADQLSEVTEAMAAKADGLDGYLGPWVAFTILNSFGTSAMNALQRLAGVTDIAAGYSVDFDSTEKGEFRIFLYDRDVHGNGTSEVAQRFMHILHIQRHGEDENSRLLPSDDFYSALEEELLQCPQYHADSNALSMLSQPVSEEERAGDSLLGYVRDSAAEVLENAEETWKALDIKGRPDMWQLPILRFQIAAISAEKGLETDDLVRATTVCWNGCPECLLNREAQNTGITGELLLDKAILDEWFREGRSLSGEYFVVTPSDLASGTSAIPYGRLSAVALNLERKRIRSVTLPHAIGIELERAGEEPRIIVRDSDIDGHHLFDAPANLPGLGIQTLGFKRLIWHDLVMTAFLDMLGLIEEGRKSISAAFYDSRDIDFEDVGISDRMLAAISQRRDKRGRFDIPEKLSEMLVWLSSRGYEVAICVDKGNLRDFQGKRFLTALKDGGCKVFVKDLGSALMHGKAIRTPLGVVFGSANLSMRGTLTNEEIVNYVPFGNVGYSQLAVAVNDILYAAEKF